MTTAAALPPGKGIEHPMQRRNRKPSVHLEQIDREAREHDAEPPPTILPFGLGKHHEKAIACLTPSEQEDFMLLWQELNDLYGGAFMAWEAKQHQHGEPQETTPEPTPPSSPIENERPREDSASRASGLDDETQPSTDEARIETEPQDEVGTTGEGNRDATEAQELLNQEEEQPDDDEIDPEEQARMDAAFAAALEADASGNEDDE